MSRAPLYALTAAVFAIAAVAIVTSPEPRVALAVVPPAPPIPESPPSTASPLAGAADGSVLTEIEVALTEEAASRSTTTSSTTTTAAEAATETTSEASENAQAPAESPSGNRPAPTTTTTTAPPTTTTTEAPPPPPPEGYFDSGAESEFAGKIAGVRSANGYGGLSRDGSLDAYARSWAKQMADSGSLGHSNTGALMPPWSAVAENVGQGGSVSAVFDLLAGSSGHLANMLGDFTHMGIGVWREADGSIWTAHVFARS